MKYIPYPGEHDIDDDTETVTFQSKADETELRTHPRFFIRLSRGQIKYDVGLLTLETPIDFSNSTFSHIRSMFAEVEVKGCQINCFRPICLGDADDLSLNLAQRKGVVGGWGATEVSYTNTLCGFKKGITVSTSLSNKLKKLEGLG